MRINLIWAQSRNGVIGRDGALPWHIPKDLARFRTLTLGAYVVMGRNTWDSLPDAYRPLPGRQNIVMTSNSAARFEGACTFPTVRDAVASLMVCAQNRDVWVIGGEQILAAFEPYAERIELTLIDKDFEGDAYAPAIGLTWHEADRRIDFHDDGTRLEFTTFRRGAP